jgi:DNA repair protein RecO (recombination protein O)
MFVKSRGVVLRQIPYNDNSVILKIFSERSGIVSAINKRSTSAKSKNKKTGLLMPLTLIDLEYEIKPNDSFIRIKEIKLNIQCVSNSSFDIYKNNIKLFLGEVLGACLRDHHGEDSLFDFTFGAIVYLNSTLNNPKNFHLAFLSQLCKHFGICPEEEYNITKPYFNIETGQLQQHQPIFYPIGVITSQLLFKLFSLDYFEEVDRLIIDNSERRELLRLLVKYLDLYLHTLGNIKSLAVLEEVFE